MTERLLTPTKITAWLDCGHFLTLQHQVESGELARVSAPFGSFAQLLMEKGQTHEAACLAEYEAQGLRVLRVSPRERDEPFAAWVARIGNPLTSDHDVIYQLPLIHNGIRGVADFVVRSNDPITGADIWEPVDAKLARTAAKPGHVLQLCFYADALEALTGRAPIDLRLWLGSGRFETIRASEVRPYWRRLRRQLARVMEDGAPQTPTTPEPCTHCEFCDFAELCQGEWKDADSLIYVAGIRGGDRAVLESTGVTTMGRLAELSPEDGGPEGLTPDRFGRLVSQAALQVSARAQEPDAPPPFTLIEPGDDPIWGRGFEAMPEPDDGDVFLDFEGHPFWRPDRGLFFLMGLIARSPGDPSSGGEWEYVKWEAHDLAGEALITAELVEWLAERRAAHPAMHVYHYNHTERSALQALAATHGVAQAELGQLVDTGLFVDLFTIARNAIQAGTPSYGLKHLERLAGYVRDADNSEDGPSGGADAVVEYEAFLKDGDQRHLADIAAYNEDDVQATLALRDWLVAQRPIDLAWRPAMVDLEDPHPELDELVNRLHEFGPDTSEHLLGDVMGYWLREWRAYKAPKLIKLATDGEHLVEDLEVVTGLTFVDEHPRVGKSGRTLKGIGLEFAFPPQDIGLDLRAGAQVFYALPDGMTGYSAIDSIDPAEGRLTLNWNDTAQELGAIPGAIVLNSWVRPNPKPEALDELGHQVLDPADKGTPNPAIIALLAGEGPRFVEGHGPAGGLFTEDLADMKDWVCHLDRSSLAIQGPPGTGKTYRGAHIVHSLVKANMRVGITAMSHAAIDNFMAEVVEVMADQGDLELLRAVRKGAEPATGALPRVEYVNANPPCARPDYNVVAGTTWLFAGSDMRAAPVDVLIIDEAGQLSLADAIAAMSSCRNVVLLGDPLQLPQVSQAAHPGTSGRSVLEHVLDGHATIADDRGIFLSETRRMHDDVCGFISDQIYEGRLKSHVSCRAQGTGAGTGLRWLRADHEGCSTSSEAEAVLVAGEVRRLMGMDWTDQHGETRPLTVDDFMVVAPYNDQVHLVRAYLEMDPVTRGVRVGTVDKFQGQQAPVVFFTMTTSTADDMPRGAEFLFSRNRLNVAISRARCLAYLVCTEELLDSRAHGVEDMRLISTLCAFVEAAIEAARYRSTTSQRPDET